MPGAMDIVHLAVSCFHDDTRGLAYEELIDDGGYAGSEWTKQLLRVSNVCVYCSGACLGVCHRIVDERSIEFC